MGMRRSPWQRKTFARGIENNEYRYALVFPEDAFGNGFGFKVKLLQNPRNQIETQTTEGLIQKNLMMAYFENIWDLPILKMDPELVEGFVGPMAELISELFEVPEEEVRSVFREDSLVPDFTKMMDQWDSEVGEESATGEAESDNLLGQMMHVEKERIVGREIKNPQGILIVAGYSVMFLLFTLNGVSSSLFEEKQAGIFLRLLSSPVTRAHILWSKYLFGILMGMMQMLTMFFASWVIFRVEIFFNFPNLVAAMFFVSIACTALGMLICSVVKTQAQANGLGTLIIISMSAVGGAWFPVSFMPAFIQSLSKLTVVYWSVEALLRTAFEGKMIYQMATIVAALLLMTAVFISISLWRFKKGRSVLADTLERILRKGGFRGLLSYAAESLDLVDPIPAAITHWKMGLSPGPLIFQDAKQMNNPHTRPMKIPTYFLTGLLALGVWSPLRSQTDVSSTITEVDVYTGSARVTRQADVTLEGGENVLRFLSLPSPLDANQIQIGLLEGVPIRLDNLKYEISKDREDNAEEKRIKDAIEDLQKEIKALNADKNEQQGRMGFARSLAGSFTKAFGENVTGEDALSRATEIMEFEQATLKEADAAMRRIDEKLVEKGEDLKELTEDLAEATRKANRLQGEVTVRLFAAESGTAKLVFNYLVPIASWYPSYAVRVDSNTNSMELVYQANIWQDSGESWNDVAVNVSTSQPDRSGNVPQLRPVFLQPNQTIYKRQMPAAAVPPPAEQEVFELSSFRADKAADGFAASTTTQAGMSSFSATLPTRVTLESAREPSRFPILTKDFQARFWSEVVAAEQEKGFLKTETSNAFDLPLMPGQAQVFIDGTLTSRVSVPYALPGDELELSLGVDDFIIVKRKETLRETEYAGIIDKTTVLKRAYTVEVTNFHPMVHEVKVFERFPISRNEKIEVKRKLPNASAVEIEEDTGVFFWKESLNAKQMKAYKVEFDVVHPREWNLDGQI